MKLTPFKKGLMRALLDDEDALSKLSDIYNKLGLEAWNHEQKARTRREEQEEVKELISTLTMKKEVTS